MVSWRAKLTGFVFGVLDRDGRIDEKACQSAC